MLNQLEESVSKKRMLKQVVAELRGFTETYYK